MFEHNSLPSNADLQLIYKNMLKYATRQTPKVTNLLGLENFKVQESVEILIDQQTQIIRNISTQISSLLLEFMSYREMVEENLEELHEQIEQKSIDLQNMQEVITHLEVFDVALQKKVQSYQEQYSKLKQVTHSLVDSHAANELKCKQQIQILEEQIISLNKSTKLYSDKTSELQNEKDLLLCQLSQQKNLTNQKSQQIMNIKAQIKKKFEEQLKKDKFITQLVNQKQKIQANYDFCCKALKKCQQQLEKDDQVSILDKAISDKPCKKTRKSQKTNKNHKRQTLTNRLPFTPFYQFSWSYLQHESKRGIHNQLDCLSLDPYFAHFVLTSQSVKIREDCQELLNIDVKPYYKDIVERRVPMHMWDQWIRNKLRELHRRNRKQSSGFTSEEQFS